MILTRAVRASRGHASTSAAVTAAASRSAPPTSVSSGGGGRLAATHGWHCPGWHREPLPVRPGSRGRPSGAVGAGWRAPAANPGVLCASCNARKGLSQRRRDRRRAPAAPRERPCRADQFRRVRGPTRGDMGRSGRVLLGLRRRGTRQATASRFLRDLYRAGVALGSTMPSALASGSMTHAAQECPMSAMPSASVTGSGAS